MSYPVDLPHNRIQSAFKPFRPERVDGSQVGVLRQRFFANNCHPGTGGGCCQKGHGGNLFGNHDRIAILGQRLA